MASRRAIDSFLACRRIAFVGASRDPKDFSRSLYRAFAERGYDVVPVNANGGVVEGREAALRVADVPPPVEGALLMTQRASSAALVRECAAAGIPRVWLYRGGGEGAVSPEAVAAARELELEVVDGACPFMFLSGTSLVHRLHGFLHRLVARAEA